MFHLTPKGSNEKLDRFKGKNAATRFAVSTSGRETCPLSCPLRGAGCYADSGPLALHWNAVTAGTRGGDFAAFCAAVSALPDGTRFRHNQAGDLPTVDGALDTVALARLRAASAHLDRPFTYTHHTDGAYNRAAIAATRTGAGLAVNASADTVNEADELIAAGCLTCVTVPSDAPAVQRTPAGNRLVVCPEQQGKSPDCASCMLCGDVKRTVIIGFRAHGAKTKTVDNRLNG